MVIDVPRRIVPHWLFSFLLHWRVRRFLGDAAVPSHPLHGVLWRPATPREQLADNL